MPRFGSIGVTSIGFRGGGMRVDSRGVVTLLQVSYAAYFGRWQVYVYSVPTEYSVLARQHLLSELPRVRNQLSAVGLASRGFEASIVFNLSEAEIAAKRSAE
jgi:hypothetical protein